jgi:hypothetical protein
VIVRGVNRSSNFCKQGTEKLFQPHIFLWSSNTGVSEQNAPLTYRVSRERNCITALALAFNGN